MPEALTATLYKDTDLLIFAGGGGVGKTTVAAATALSAALEGRRVAVLTIDPARRLGSALGLRRLGNRLRTIPDSKLDRYRREAGGKLAAAMLDTKGTFDAIVERYISNATVRERILSNRIYQSLSEALSGTHEYMALERIYEIRATGEYDLLVLDTPPASALEEFLEAPARLRSFLDRDIVHWFLPEKRSGWVGIAASAISRGIGWALSLLDRLAGGTILEDLASFLKDFQLLFDGLNRRISEVEKLFRAERTSFVLVATPDAGAKAIAESMAHSLDSKKLPLSGVILNRTVRDSVPAGEASGIEKALRETARALRSRTEKVRSEFRREWPDVPTICVPLREKDPSSLPDLAALFD